MGLFDIGVSGINGYQTALDVTGSNIVNAGTPGYNRQVVNFGSSGSGNYGNGLSVLSVENMYDSFVNTQLRYAMANYQQLSIYYQYSSSLDSFLGNDSSNISAAIDDLFFALHDLTHDPSSNTSREVFLNQNQMLSSRFHEMVDELDRQMATINNELQASVEQVNNLTKSIADINTRVTGDSEKDGPLIAEREYLLQQLSEYLPITAVTNDNGQVDVFMSTGDTLVMGGNVSTLSTKPSTTDPSKLDLTIESQYSYTRLNNGVSGGYIGGLLAYREEVLEPTFLEINRLAIVFADSMNAQHQMGMDLDNQLGGNLFTDINAVEQVNNRVVSNTNNTGSADFSVTIDDVGQLEASNYQLVFSSASDYTLTRLSDGQLISSGTMASYPAQLSFDGVTMEIDNASITAGDSFLVSPTRHGAAKLDVEITSADKLALASPIRTTTGYANTGSASIAIEGITDISNSSFSTSAQLSPPIRIEFLSPTSYQLVNTDTASVIEGPITYDPTITNTIFPTPGNFDPGYVVSLTGNAAQGDQFTIEYNIDGFGDNSNVLLLAGIQSEKTVGGNANFQENYNTLLGTVASKTNYAAISMDAAQASLQQAQIQQEAVSGVNLDEEVVNLMQYQQAYMACAQIIMVANSTFDTLLGIM